MSVQANATMQFDIFHRLDLNNNPFFCRRIFYVWRAALSGWAFCMLTSTSSTFIKIYDICNPEMCVTALIHLNTNWTEFDCRQNWKLLTVSMQNLGCLTKRKKSAEDGEWALQNLSEWVKQEADRFGSLLEDASVCVSRDVLSMSSLPNKEW